MARKDSAETQIAKLAALKELARIAPSSPELLAELRKGLSSSVYLVVIRATQLAGELQRTELIPDLIAAFHRFHGDGKMDKGCEVTTAVLRTLVDGNLVGNYDAVGEVFSKGVRYVQREAGFGPPRDVAGELRGLCAMGLVKIRDRGALLHLTDLLTDPEPPARAGAARAIGFIGHDMAALLLRLKLAEPDREPEVTGECLAALLRLRPAWGLEFVARYLEEVDPAIRQSAALALGESRQTEALPPLAAALKRETDQDVLRSVALAMTMLRTPEARDVLIGVIASGTTAHVEAVLEALAIFKLDPAVRMKVDSAVAARNDPRVLSLFRGAFEA